MSALPQQASPAPDTVPSLDQSIQQIGPNMASDPDFCKVVMDYSWRNEVYPKVLQQQTLWPTWKRIDDAFRVKGSATDLDISAVDPQFVNKNADGKGAGGLRDRNDGYSSRVYPATLHKQIVTKTDMHVSIAWSDGLPVRAEKDEYEVEHPLYNPIQQSVDAFNQELARCAREVRLKRQDRKGRGSFCKYGHVWAMPDFRLKMETVPESYVVPQDPQLQMQMEQDMLQRYGGQKPQLQQTPFGIMATWSVRKITAMETHLVFLRVDDVFVDQTLPCDDMEQQLCPVVRSRVNRGVLFGNDYDPVSNPFGYLNTQQAMNDSNPQWSFSTSDTIFQQELLKKWGLAMSGQIMPQNALKQKWTLYPKLGIYQDPKTGKLALDDGTGIECPQCQGKRNAMDQGGQTHDCPMCSGSGKYFVKPERYVVEAYGNLEFSNSSATVLRIQRNPTPKDRVPLLFSANLSEDTAGAIPLSKSEASLKAVDQEATSLNQWFNSKNKQIDPGWLVPADGFDVGTDLGQHGKNFPCENPDVFKSLAPTYDTTQNMESFMDRQQSEVMAINGMSDQLLGIVSSGRRPATELQNAFDASKMPITIEVDQYNEDIMGGWARFHQEAIEAFAPKEWIYEKTGRTAFGNIQLFTAVADEFMKRQAAIGNFQYIAQLIAPIPGANLQPVLSAMWSLMKLPGNPDEVLPDGGMKKARADGMRIVTQICGEGQMIPPQQSDPHAVYIQIFEQALQDPYWQKKTPETLPLLQQRYMMQLQMQAMQMQQQLAAQQHQLMLAHAGASLGQHFKPQMNPQQGGNGNQPAMSNQAPANSGGANQQLMGGVQ